MCRSAASGARRSAVSGDGTDLITLVRGLHDADQAYNREASLADLARITTFVTQEKTYQLAESAADSVRRAAIVLSRARKGGAAAAPKQLGVSR